ncbi:hypothetical protein [Bacillus sp. FJAT-27445]|uniref:hypothetical protein n=1 Tax=Bacillus sp. FJAT-27445 TaxID=1679166 RepID=UPI000743FC1E|nr:hypothetical protein [Bacillus sp. FJAT-27445]
MKKPFKIAIPALALGLAFSTVTSASAISIGQKSESTLKVSASVSNKTAAKHKADKEAKKRLATINKNIAKVESSNRTLAKAIVDIYAKATAGTLSVKVEAEFHKSTSGKLKANSNQLKALKSQVDQVAKKYGKTESVNAAYAKITAQTNVISQEQKKLNDLHTQFVQAQKAKDAAKLTASIQESVVKAEAKVAALSKATAEFYTKAVTVPVTANAELDFYKKTSADLTSVSSQLTNAKKQLDGLVKSYGKTDATTALYVRVATQNEAIAVAKKNLDNLHSQFLQKDAVNQVAAINAAVLKAEANLAATSKNIADFYANAATTPVTVKAELDFYKKNSADLTSLSNGLANSKKQLDGLVKSYGKTDATTAVYAKISAQNEAIAVAKKNLDNLHSQYLQKEAAKQVAAINDAVLKAEANLAATSKNVTDFYVKAATTPVTAKEEADFHKKATGEIHAHAVLLPSLKKQLDAQVKLTGKTDAAVAIYAKITVQTEANAAAKKKLDELHSQFLKAEVAKQVAVISGEVAKVEARVAAAAKATVEFYAKAATVPVTAKAEAEFYVNMTGELAASSVQLSGLKKQLDDYVKKHGKTEASLALHTKINVQNQAIATASKTLVELHINFKPASA